MVAPNEPRITQEQADRLLHAIDCMTAAEALTDEQLSNAASSVLGTMHGQAYAIINELIERFEDRAGIKRDETGEIVKDPTVYYVIRFPSGTFFVDHGTSDGDTVSLSEASRWLTREDAQAVADTFVEESTVIEVKS